MLKPNNVQVSTVSSIGKGGQISRVERATFWVGAHGPFYTPDYPYGQDNSLAIQAAIRDKVQQLQQLESAVQ